MRSNIEDRPEPVLFVGGGRRDRGVGMTRLTVLAVIAGVIMFSAAPSAAAGRRFSRLEARLHGSAAFHSLRGELCYRRTPETGHVHVFARNLRPIRGEEVSTYVHGMVVGQAVVDRNGRYRAAAAGSGLVEHYEIHEGSRILLEGPNFEVVARGRLGPLSAVTGRTRCRR